jgi:hypothetical protein
MAAAQIAKGVLYPLYANFDWNSCGPITPPTCPTQDWKASVKAAPVVPFREELRPGCY